MFSKLAHAARRTIQFAAPHARKLTSFGQVTGVLANMHPTRLTILASGLAGGMLTSTVFATDMVSKSHKEVNPQDLTKSPDEVMEKSFHATAHGPETPHHADASAKAHQIAGKLLASQPPTIEMSPEPEVIKSKKGRDKWVPSAPHYPRGTVTALTPGAKLIVIGDVHGCYDELVELLEECGFNGERGDLVVLAGDLVGKGPKSLHVLRLARELGNNGLVVRGNHEQVLIDWKTAIERSDGKLSWKDMPKRVETHAQCAASMTADEWLWLESMPLWISIPQIDTLIVHAGVVPSVPLLQQSPNMLMNLRTLLPLEVVHDGPDEPEPMSNSNLAPDTQSTVGEPLLRPIDCTVSQEQVDSIRRSTWQVGAAPYSASDRDTLASLRLVAKRDFITDVDVDVDVDVGLSSEADFTVPIAEPEETSKRNVSITVFKSPFGTSREQTVMQTQPPPSAMTESDAAATEAIELAPHSDTILAGSDHGTTISKLPLHKIAEASLSSSSRTLPQAATQPKAQVPPPTQAEPPKHTHVRATRVELLPTHTASHSHKVGQLWATEWMGPTHIIFGHDARTGLQIHPYATGLDTGACYGNGLTALVFDDPCQTLAPDEVAKRVAAEQRALAEKKSSRAREIMLELHSTHPLKPRFVHIDSHEPYVEVDK